MSTANYYDVTQWPIGDAAADIDGLHFIAECGSCIELRGWGQASKITDNLIGAGPKGHSIYAEHRASGSIGGDQRPARVANSLL